MISKNQLSLAKPLFCAVLMLGLLTGCLDEKKTASQDVSYTPETRPLGIIAGAGAEYSPGSQVSLTGRLVGTVTNQTILWEQIEGDKITTITDWTKPNLSFVAPEVDGIKAFKFQISARDAAGKIVNDADGKPLVSQVTISVFDPKVLVTLEVEDNNFATLNGVKLASLGDANYINGAVGSHTVDITPGNSVTFNIPSGSKIGDKTLKAGFYTLYVRYAIPSAYGGKHANVAVNGVANDAAFEATGSWEKFRVGVIKLNEGANIIEIGGGWSYYRLDDIILIPAPAPAKPLAVAPTLVNANATSEAKDLQAFLVSGYGSKIISGQTEFFNYADSAQTGLREFDKVVSITGGAAPAIEAFDLTDYSSSRVKCGAKSGTLSEDMIKAHKDKNVILSPLWHWNAPTKLIDATCNGSGDTAWYKGFYTNASTFDLKAALADPNGADYKALITDIDNISVELKKFQDAGIPLLWRPLHEAQGAWFWWGNAGAESYKTLWRLMYQRMTVTNGLNNLIWVFTNTGDSNAAWYPGDDVVDIVGYDGYDGKNAGNPFKANYATLKDRFDGKKLVALTETGTIPNVAKMHTENTFWAYFVTWNSGGDYGPANADPAIIQATYADPSIVNLKDVPGGRAKVEAGVLDGFEIPVGTWGAQVSWSGTTGMQTSSAWAASGLNSLSLTKNLSKETAPSNVVFQIYPEGGVDLKGKSKLKVAVNSSNSGTGTTAYLFVKHGKDWIWASTSAVPANAAVLEMDVSQFDTLAGYGVVFEGFDKASTAANFYIDKVQLDSAVLYDFEPKTSGWETQVSWSPTAGGTVSNAWANSGARSLALVKDLSKETAPSNVVFQNYPEGGIDLVAAKAKTLSIAVNSKDSGAGTTAYVFVKHGKDWVWASTSAVAASSATIAIDVSAYDTLAGYGVVFEGFDKTSTAAKFYVDSVKLDSNVLYDFEGTGAWEFQVNWSGTSGIQLATDWAQSGANSLVGITQLKAGDDNIILQTYPAGNLLLGKVSKIKITAHAKDAGADLTAELFAKDKNGTWKDGGEVPVVDGTASLSLDISGWDEVQGFGVRFQHPSNFTTPSNYYIDDVTFE